MTRFNILDRADMSEEQRRLSDNIEATDGILGGPYWAYIRNPAYLRLHHEMRTYLRNTPLTDRERQLAVLVAVRFWDAVFSWVAQARAALAHGINQDTIDAIDARLPPRLDDAREKAVFDVATELLSTHRVSDATYASAEALFGLEALTDLVVTIGFYSLVAMTANAFDITPPGDTTARLRDP